MSWEKGNKKRLPKYFWTEINQAILNSPGVHFSIKKLEKLQLLDYVAKFNFLLQLDKLIESIFKKGAKKETKDNSGYEETQLHDEPELETLEKNYPKIFPHFLPIRPCSGLTARLYQKMKSFLKNILAWDSMKEAKIRFDR